jgi:DNA oxidative demethylase
MHGVVARRTVGHFGWRYGFDSARIRPGPELPQFLLDLRARCARLIEVPAERLEEALVTRYPPGAAIGWHRDAPAFGSAVVGVSLLGACTLRFRRADGNGWFRYDRVLEPRSAYVISGTARTSWQHSLAPVRSLRYSVTFRTLRGKAARSA